MTIILYYTHIKFANYILQAYYLHEKSYKAGQTRGWQRGVNSTAHVLMFVADFTLARHDFLVPRARSILMTSSQLVNRGAPD